MATEHSIKLSLNKGDEEEEKVLKRCWFVTTLGEHLTDVCYKVFNNHYLVIAIQELCLGLGDTGVGRIIVNKPPPDDSSPEAKSTIAVVLDCDGFQKATRQIALGLDVDKPLHLHLCLNDFSSEAINNLIQALLPHV